MDENNNIIQKRPFGLNVALPKKAMEEVKKAAKLEAEHLSQNLFSNQNFEELDVYNGTVSKEIRKYQAQIYNLGQLVREGQPTRTFRMEM